MQKLLALVAACFVAFTPISTRAQDKPKFGLPKMNSLVEKAKKSAGALGTVKSFANSMGKVDSFKAKRAPNGFLVNIGRKAGSQLAVNKAEKFGVKVNSLNFAKDIAFKAGRESSKVGLSDIKGIGLGLNVGGLPKNIDVGSASLKKDASGRLHFLTDVVHKSIPKPLPIDIPLKK